MGETSLDFYALSFAMYPKTMAEHYAEQEAQTSSQQMKFDFNEDGDALEEDIDQIFLDDEYEGVVEEGIDSEL